MGFDPTTGRYIPDTPAAPAPAQAAPSMTPGVDPGQWQSVFPDIPQVGSMGMPPPSSGPAPTITGTPNPAGLAAARNDAAIADRLNVAGSPTAKVPKPGAQTTPQSNATVQRLIANNLPYLAMGMLAGRGGTPGIATAAGIAALSEYMKSRRAAQAAAKKQVQDAAGEQIGTLDKSVRAKGGSVKKYARGGKVRGFRGGMSPKLASIAEDTKKGERMRPMAPPPMGGPAPEPTIPAPKISRFVPGSQPIRKPGGISGGGRFASGGMVRGSGAAIKGNKFKGEC